MIQDADSYWKDYKGFIQHRARISRQKVTNEIDPGLTVAARVNHGRWIADCPYCKGAEMVSKSNPVFLCLSCFNNGGKRIPVVFPDNITEIEEALSIRPVHNQNWESKETIKILQTENLLMLGVKG